MEARRRDRRGGVSLSGCERSVYGPLILTAEAPEIVIPVKGPCQRLHILGQVTFGEGFPLAGKDGEQVASYTLEFSKGKNREIPLRNGYEVAQANSCE